MPDGLHALLAARLDALDPDLRALVAEAAVLGGNAATDEAVIAARAALRRVRSGDPGARDDYLRAVGGTRY